MSVLGASPASRWQRDRPAFVSYMSQMSVEMAARSRVPYRAAWRSMTAVRWKDGDWGRLGSDGAGSYSWKGVAGGGGWKPDGGMDPISENARSGRELRRERGDWFGVGTPFDGDIFGCRSLGLRSAACGAGASA